MPLEFSKYFDSYENRSPLWVERVRGTGDNTPGIRREEWPSCEQVTQSTHPKMYGALIDECAYRCVELPMLYVDHSGQTRLARALPREYSILVDRRTETVFNQGEARALVAHELKHLYQGEIETVQQSFAAEYDSDRAAVRSTDYLTISMYVHKTIHLMIDDKIPTPAIRKLLHAINNTFRGTVAEVFVFQLDKWHPSPARRMKAMFRAAQHHLEGAEIRGR